MNKKNYITNLFKKIHSIFEKNRIKHIDIVLFMKVFIIYTICYIVLLIIRLFSFLEKFDIRWFILITLSLIFLLFLIQYRTFKLSDYFDNTVILKDIDGIPSYTKLLDYYTSTLPFFLISLAMFFMTLLSFHIYFLLIGSFFYLITPLLLLFMSPTKSAFDRKIYYTLSRADDICEGYICKNKTHYSIINTFNNYFKKSLKNIEFNLGSGMQIGNSRIANLSTTEFIARGLPLYIRFGNQSQIKALKNNIKTMKKYVNKNDENDGNFKIDLEILKPILNIKQDIIDFLNLNNISIGKKRGMLTALKSHSNISTAMNIITVLLASATLYIALHEKNII